MIHGFVPSYFAYLYPVALRSLKNPDLPLMLLNSALIYVDYIMQYRIVGLLFKLLIGEDVKGSVIIYFKVSLHHWPGGIKGNR
jgi:hypothetical protein